MHIHHDPSCFFNITGLAIQVVKIVSQRMSVHTGFATSSLIALIMSPGCPLFLCLIGTLPDTIFRLCSMTLLSTLSMYAGCQVNTFENIFRSTISLVLVSGDRSTTTYIS